MVRADAGTSKAHYACGSSCRDHPAKPGHPIAQRAHVSSARNEREVLGRAPRAMRLIGQAVQAVQVAQISQGVWARSMHPARKCRWPRSSMERGQRHAM